MLWKWMTFWFEMGKFLWAIPFCCSVVFFLSSVASFFSPNCSSQNGKIKTVEKCTSSLGRQLYVLVLVVVVVFIVFFCLFSGRFDFCFWLIDQLMCGHICRWIWAWTWCVSRKCTVKARNQHENIKFPFSENNLWNLNERNLIALEN